MSKNVLIAGGSGRIGSQLTKNLIEKNYTVSWLSHSQKAMSGVKTYNWDYKGGIIEDDALQGVDVLINLAGVGIGDRKWTKERKKAIKDSRIKATEFLHQEIEEQSVNLEAYITASAIGYYGYDSGSIEKKEGSRFGDDFLATLTKDWEAAADNFTNNNIRTVKFRTGFVIGKNQKGWERISGVVKTGFGAAVGSGEQYMSWIHEKDLCRLYEWAIENTNCNGVYNAVAPNPVTNKEFTKATAKALGKPLFLPNVPGFILRLIYGEIASALLGSSRVSSEKIRNEGFEFNYPSLEQALKEIVSK